MNSKSKITTLLLLILSACHKEPLKDQTKNIDPAIKTSLTLDEAKQYILQLNPDRAKALSKIKIDWDRAKSEPTRQGNKWTILLTGQPTYQNYKQGYRQLVILRNSKNEKIEAKILEIIPDAIYLQKTGKSIASDFTGRVFVYNLNYKLTGGRLFSGGKPVGTIKQFTEQQEIDQANKILSEQNPFSGRQAKIMRIAITACHWMQDYYIDAAGELNIHSTQVCSTTYIDGGGGGYYDGVGSNGSSEGLGGGTGGNTGNASPPTPSNLPGENNDSVDPKKMMECFNSINDPNAAFVIRVYVSEPFPGTSFNVGPNSFGHVAISLSKTSGNKTITQTVGFYPTGTGLGKLNSKSQVHDNGFTEYDINSTYYVSQESFQKVINFISNPVENYHFTDYNCATFVYNAGQAGGIPIPDPTTQIGISGPGGAGYATTPAGMASALRAQKQANPNADISEASGRIPASKGECN